MVAEDLSDELDRWSAYAQAAEDDAFRRAREVGAMVAVAVREATFLSDLGQRNEVSLAAMMGLLDEAEACVRRTETQLRLRHESWMHSQQIADHAVVAWTAALDHALTELGTAEARLVQARRKRDRLTVRVCATETDAAGERDRVHTLARHRASRERQRPNVRQLVAEAEAAVGRAEECVQVALERVTRHEMALHTAGQAEELVARSLRDLAQGLQSAGLAVDFAASARAVLGRASAVIDRQSDRAQDMMRESKQAVRAMESSGRVLGAVSLAYDEAQQHVFDARVEIDERISVVRGGLARARLGLS